VNDVIRPIKEGTSPSLGSSMPGVPQPSGIKAKVSPSKLNLINTFLLYLVVLILVVGAVVYAFHRQNLNKQSLNSNASESSQVNSSEYQAVFLTNGQIYFGKLTTITSSYVKLANIYYLVTQQPQGSASSSTSSSNSSSSSVVLVKLGSEIHSPEDAMQIYRSQILFWENLKPSGKVAQAIAKYQQ
jgi:hypothetical protein